MATKMSDERIELGLGLMASLEELIKRLDIEKSEYSFKELIFYMEHIKSKMAIQFLANDHDTRILEQILKMGQLIDYVADLRDRQIASSM
jgi:hypothetical protein